MNKRNVLIVAAVVLFPLMAWAGGITIEAYTTLGVRPIQPVINGDGDESADLATPLAPSRVKETLGNTTIAVACDLSVSGATVLVSIALLDKDGDLLTLVQSTATATRFRTAAAGDFVAQPLLFDTLGANKYEVRHDDPSTGTVDIRTWVLGSQPQ